MGVTADVGWIERFNVKTSTAIVCTYYLLLYEVFVSIYLPLQSYGACPVTMDCMVATR